MDSNLYPDKPRRRPPGAGHDLFGKAATQPPAAQGRLLPEAAPKLQSITYNGLTWIYVERPALRDIRELARLYPNFHPLNLDDCLSRIQRPKIDEYPDHMFVVLHFPVLGKEHHLIAPSEMDIFIGKDYLVTVHCSGDLTPLSSLFQACQSSEETRAQAMSRGAPYLFYKVLDGLVDYCFPILNDLLDRVDRVEDRLFSGRQLEMAQQISEVRRSIISFRRIVHPQVSVIESLERVPHPILKGGEQDIYFGDIADHIRRIWDGLQDAKDIMDGLSDTGNWRVSHRIQHITRILTVVVAILTPLSVLSKFFGMNIFMPLTTDPPGDWLALVLHLVVLVTMATGLIYLSRRKGWI